MCVVSVCDDYNLLHVKIFTAHKSGKVLLVNDGGGVVRVVAMAKQLLKFNLYFKNRFVCRHSRRRRRRQHKKCI